MIISPVPESLKKAFLTKRDFDEYEALSEEERFDKWEYEDWREQLIEEECENEETRKRIEEIRKGEKEHDQRKLAYEQFEAERLLGLLEERRVNLKDVARLPHAPKTLLTALQNIKGDEEYWIHEFGNEFCPLLPSFWKYKPDGTSEKLPTEYKFKRTHKKINISRKQYSSVAIAGKSFDCHALSACAFIKNLDPKFLTQVDHRTDPNDELLVEMTRVIWIMLKRHFGNMHSLQPHFCNFAPIGLQFLSAGQNQEANGTEDHKLFKHLVRDYNLEESLKDVSKIENDKDKLQNLVNWGDCYLDFEFLDWDKEKFENHMRYGLKASKDGVMQQHRLTVSNVIDLGRANQQRVEQERFAKLYELLADAGKALEYLQTEGGDKNYIKVKFKREKEVSEKFDINPYVCFGYPYKAFENAFLAPFEDWTEDDWDDLTHYIQKCVYNHQSGKQPKDRIYKNKLFSNWAKGKDACSVGDYPAAKRFFESAARRDAERIAESYGFLKLIDQHSMLTLMLDTTEAEVAEKFKVLATDDEVLLRRLEGHEKRSFRPLN
tara:strand:- start:428 stop:2071 length:1644 start_codon:yes stop_codon:yes gene_type:complete